jgi:hypothetical protein
VVMTEPVNEAASTAAASGWRRTAKRVMNDPACACCLQVMTSGLKKGTVACANFFSASFQPSRVSPLA